MKSLAINAAFQELKEKLNNHKKVKHLDYKTLEIQPYLVSDGLSEEGKKTLTALRSHCLKGIRHNFPKMYKMSLKCPLECNKEAPQDDTQEHILSCTKLSKGTQMNMDLIVDQHSEEQAKVAILVSSLLRKRLKLLEDQEDSSTSLPGASFLDHNSQQQLQLGVAATQYHIV